MTVFAGMERTASSPGADPERLLRGGSHGKKKKKVCVRMHVFVCVCVRGAARGGGRAGWLLAFWIRPLHTSMFWSGLRKRKYTSQKIHKSGVMSLIFSEEIALCGQLSVSKKVSI